MGYGLRARVQGWTGGRAQQIGAESFHTAAAAAAAAAAQKRMTVQQHTEYTYTRHDARGTVNTPAAHSVAREGTTWRLLAIF